MSFDLTTVYHKDRPLSWSAISSFEWNPRQWYEKYVLKILPEETEELKFGKMVDEKIQADPTFIPELVRFPILQHEMKIEWQGIPLIGYADAYLPPENGRRIAVRDYKTGRKEWTQKRADETGQLTMYLFMLYLMDRKIDVAKADLYIDWLPTHYEDGKLAFRDNPVKPITFKTKRSMVDVLNFGRVRIPQAWKGMQEYAEREAKSVVHTREDFFN